MDVTQTIDTKRKPVYEELRPLLFWIAYQLVGSTSDAEERPGPGTGRMGGLVPHRRLRS